MFELFQRARWDQAYDYLASGDPPIICQAAGHQHDVSDALHRPADARDSRACANRRLSRSRRCCIAANCLILFQRDIQYFLEPAHLNCFENAPRRRLRLTCRRPAGPHSSSAGFRSESGRRSPHSARIRPRAAPGNRHRDSGASPRGAGAWTGRESSCAADSPFLAQF